ncbi:MAG: hypothetical protein BMS9Abin36_0744 [Gammaproteobacteria bacterium]|nr:MAG: hypothetical protein BMS9Abin36_0744 [Gammaproteobacteria bacterium]
MNRMLIATCLSFAFLSGPSLAGDFDAGLEAYNSGKFTRAANIWNELAVNGNKDAQYTLAYMYQTGKGVDQDDVRAYSWYRIASDEGHSLAQLQIVRIKSRLLQMAEAEAMKEEVARTLTAKAEY